MGKTKDRGKYQSISLSVDFIEEVKQHILKDNKYKSVADFTREAIREKIDRETPHGITIMEIFERDQRREKEMLSIEERVRRLERK